MDLTNLNKDRAKSRRKSSIDLSTMVYGKVPPQAKDLEEAVLGAIMLEKSAFDVVAEILKPECFYVDAHQRVFKVMQGLQQKNQPIDILTVVEELKSKEELETVGGPYFVTRLTNAVVSSANIEAHARIILQKFIQRELIRISGEIINDSYEDSTDVFDLLDEAEGKLFEITAAGILHLRRKSTGRPQPPDRRRIECHDHRLGNFGKLGKRATDQSLHMLVRTLSLIPEMERREHGGGIGPARAEDEILPHKRIGTVNRGNR